MRKTIICFLLLAFMLQISHSQTENLYQLEQFNKESEFQKAADLTKSIDTTAFSKSEKARYHYAYAILLINTSTDLIAPYKQLLKAKQSAPEDSLKLLFKINDELIFTYQSTIENAMSPQDLIMENCQIASIVQEPKMLIYCDFYQITDLDYNHTADSELGLKILNHSKNIALENNFDDTLKDIQYNIGVAHSLAKNNDSALYYFNELIPFYEKNKDFSTLKDLYNNKAQALKQAGDYNEAIQYYKKSLNTVVDYDMQESVIMVTRNLADTYYLNQEYEQSATLYRTKIKLSDSLKTEEAARSIEELETKYQTAEKEKQLLVSEKESQKRLYTIYMLSGIALTLILLGGMIYHNQRKKKLLAQKEQELQKQRADSILKNQELATIDAMISGQEKERKRLAEELHDNLGSSLTTVKLYFENLKKNVKDEQGIKVYDRTELILDQTYEIIRSMSHTRHNGVLASKGLIPTVETLAQKISDSGKLKVNVFHHGLDKKLENSIELIIFRIIQELLSNVVKHAHATEAVVNLTSYENTLNIMVEDNGLGFDASILPDKEGMGLSSIEKRIESIDGTFEIDSSPKRGTTINIDIPYYDQPSYS